MLYGLSNCNLFSHSSLCVCFLKVRFIGDCDIPMLENTIITCPDSGQVNCSFRCDPGTVNAIQQYGPLACTQTDTSFWEPRPLNGLCQGKGFLIES